MADYANIAEPSEEQTLFGAIRELVEISWRLNNLLFGERPPTDEKAAMAGSSIVEARRLVNESNQRLIKVIEQVERIGK
jgi:hypothetical protein